MTTAASTQAFWEAVRATPLALDAGEKRWHPYELHTAIHDAARALDDPIGTYRQLLVSERDPYWREVLLFLAGWSEDPAADDLLLDALDDAGLRPRALYLLGVPNTKGWPARERDTARIASALGRFAGDPMPYVDIVYETTLTVGDLACAAFARVTGPELLPAVSDLPAADARWIGLALPVFPPSVSAALAAEVRAALQ